MKTRTVTPTADARALRAAIRALVRRFSISERADVQCCDMTVAQAATLEALQAEGPTRMGDLGRRLGVSPSTLTRNMSRLEERGWVRRASDAADGRVSRVHLTAAGVRAADAVERGELDFAADVLRRLEPGRCRELPAVLNDLLIAVRQSTEHCCAGAFDHLMREFPEGERHHDREP